jgi:hypothetical protein
MHSQRAASSQRQSAKLVVFRAAARTVWRCGKNISELTEVVNTQSLARLAPAKMGTNCLPKNCTLVH